MTPRELGIVLFTFSGVYLVYEGVALSAGVLPQVVAAQESRGLFEAYPFSILLAFVPALLGLGGGVILIAFRSLLSDRFFGDIEARREAPAPVAPEDWRAFWVALIGVVFVVLALRDIAYTAANAIIRSVEGVVVEHRAYEVWPPRIRLGVQLVLGLFLVLGAPGLVGAWTSLRAAGRVRE